MQGRNFPCKILCWRTVLASAPLMIWHRRWWFHIFNSKLMHFCHIDAYLELLKTKKIKSRCQCIYDFFKRLIILKHFSFFSHYDIAGGHFDVYWVKLLLVERSIQGVVHLLQVLRGAITDNKESGSDCRLLRAYLLLMSFISSFSFLLIVAIGCDHGAHYHNWIFDGRS